MHFLEKERFYSSQQQNRRAFDPRLQTDSILVSALIKTLVPFVSLGSYLLSRATHLSLFPAQLPTVSVSPDAQGPSLGPGKGAEPSARVAAPVSVSLWRLSRPPTPAPASPQTGGR